MNQDVALLSVKATIRARREHGKDVVSDRGSAWGEREMGKVKLGS
jgi:hypothetical protein